MNEAALEAASDANYPRVLEILDEIVARFGVSQDAETRAQVARALSNKIAVLGEANTLDKAKLLATFDAVMRQFGGDSSPEVRFWVVRAFANRAATLSEAGLKQEALAAADELRNYLDGSEPAEARPFAATLLTDKVLWLMQMELDDEAVEAADDVARLFDRWSAEPGVRYQLCKAALLQASILFHIGRPRQARAAWDAMIEKFGSDPEQALQAIIEEGRAHLSAHLSASEHLGQAEAARKAPATRAPEAEAVEAMFGRVQIFHELGLQEEVVAACDQMLAACPCVEDLPEHSRLLLAQAMLHRASALRSTEGTEEATEAYKDMTRRFSAVPPPHLSVGEKEGLALALFNRALLHEQQQELEEAVSCYGEAISKYGAEEAMEAQHVAAKCIVNQGNDLCQLGRWQQAGEALSAAAQKFHNSEHAALREQAVMAMRSHGLCLLQHGQEDGGIALLGQVLRLFGGDDAPQVRHRAALAASDLVAALALAGYLGQAQQVAREALEHFGEDDGIGAWLAVNTALLNGAVAVDDLLTWELIQAADAGDEEAGKMLGALENPEHEFIATAMSMASEAASRIWSARATLPYENLDLYLKARLVSLSLLQKGGAEPKIVEMAVRVLGSLYNSALLCDGQAMRAGEEDRAARREVVVENAVSYAQMLQGAGNLSGSEQVFLQVLGWLAGTRNIELQCARIGALAPYAHLLLQMGRHAEALARLDEMLSLWPLNSQARRPWPESDIVQAQTLRAEIVQEMLSRGLVLPDPQAPPSAPDAANENLREVHDVPELLAALQEAGDGDIVLLHAGTYRLEEPLAISRPLRLGGMGADTTAIVCDHPQGVLELAGQGPWIVQNLEFRQESDSEDEPYAAVVRLLHGDLKVRRCTFRGGWRGLLVDAEAQALVRACTFTENIESGIHVTSYAHADIESNRIFANEQVGILLDGHAGGTVRGNECFDHHFANIAVFDLAAPLVEGNKLYRANFGIAFGGRAAGTARRNLCAANFAGIAVTDEAAPTLEANQCRGNYSYGLVFNAGATGTATRNECLGNGGVESGFMPNRNVRVFPHARPALLDNTTGDSEDEGTPREEEGLWNEEFGNRQGAQMMAMTSLMLQLDLDSLVPGLKKSGLWEKETIFDDELYLAFLIQLHSPRLDDDFVRRLLPQWVEIYKRIVAEGRQYL